MTNESTAPDGTPPTSTTFGRRTAAIVGGVVLLAIVVGVALGVVLTSNRGSALGSAASYVPDDAVMYVEARLDLPGTQREALQAVLEHFPAIDPHEILGDALADTLDEALADGDAPFDYSGDIAPWFDGSLTLAVLDYPLAMDPMSMDPMDMELPSVLGLLGVRDRSAAEALADTLRGELESSGMAFSSAERGGVTIWSLDVAPMGFMPMSGLGFAYTVTDDHLLLANAAEHIEAALDAHGGDASLADSDAVIDLVAGLPDERVALMAVNNAALLDELRTSIAAIEPELADTLGTYLDGMPPYAVSSLHFEDDAVVMSGVSGVGEGPLAASNERRQLAARAPADAILFADQSDVGPVLEQAIAAVAGVLASGPMGEMGPEMLDEIEGALGADLTEFVSWIGDGALVAGWNGSQPYGGLILEAVDPDAAARRLNQLGALAQLAAQDPFNDIDVVTETFEGVEVTSIATSGSTAGVVVEYALADEVALIGIGDQFVRGALGLDADGSLAASDRFTAAVDRFGGDDNSGVMWLDLAGLREAIESALPVGDEPELDEVRPNLEPLDYLVSVTRVDGDQSITRGGLVLR